MARPRARSSRTCARTQPCPPRRARHRLRAPPRARIDARDEEVRPPRKSLENEVRAARGALHVAARRRPQARARRTATVHHGTRRPDLQICIRSLRLAASQSREPRLRLRRVVGRDRAAREHLDRMAATYVSSCTASTSTHKQLPPPHCEGFVAAPCRAAVGVAAPAAEAANRHAVPGGQRASRVGALGLLLAEARQNYLDKAPLDDHEPPGRPHARGEDGDGVPRTSTAPPSSSSRFRRRSG